MSTGQRGAGELNSWDRKKDEKRKLARFDNRDNNQYYKYCMS